MPHRNLPPAHAKWLAPHKAPYARVQQVQSARDVLSDTQHGLATGLLAARDKVLDAKAAEAFHQQSLQESRAFDGDEFKAETARLAAETQRQQQAFASYEAQTKAATAISAATQVAFDAVVERITGLMDSGAKIDLAGTPKMPTKGSLRDIVATQRAVLADLDDEAEEVRNALAPESELLARAMSDINALEDEGRVRLTRSGDLAFAETTLPVRPTLGTEMVRVPNVPALLAALAKPALIEQVKAAIKNIYRDIPAAKQLSRDDKRAALAKLGARRFEVELVEVEAILALWATGSMDIGLRPDVDPNAVLGIRGGKGTQYTGKGTAFLGESLR